jgi:hypothetical protein
MVSPEPLQTCPPNPNRANSIWCPPNQSGNQPAAGKSATTPPPQNSPGEILDSSAAPPTPLDDQSPAQDDVPGRDSNGSKTSEETGLSK